MLRFMNQDMLHYKNIKIRKMPSAYKADSIFFVKTGIYNL